MKKNLTTLQHDVESEFLKPTRRSAAVFNSFLSLLDDGTIRTVRNENGNWIVNTWVKQGILLGFRLGKISSIPHSAPFQFFDKHTFPLKKVRLKDNIRIVPGGTSIRKGAYVAPSVIVMPPAFINVGAHVGAGTLVDSNVLVGSCAYVGERVHLSAAVQLGGVLEPVGSMPVIVEDEVVIGGNCGIFEGTIVKRRAVIGSGVILNASTPVYDLVHQTVIGRDHLGSVIIPEGAVVVAGTRTIPSPFAQEHGLHLYTPLIVKYRDERTDAKTALEESLR
jgi:2,3,4,5-tetrahydropyridine-2-carboxylate N-succinyltransferase